MPANRGPRFPTITEQGLDDLRRRIGVKITDTLEPWCHEATRDDIRHYAHGIGDDNPLWCDPEYAATTRCGGLVAPPSFLFACNRIVSGLRRRAPRRARDVGGRGLDVASARAAQRHDHDGGLAQGPDRAPDALRRPRHPADLPRGLLQSARRASWPTPTAGAFAPTATSHARRARSTRRSRRRPPKRYTDDELDEIFALYATEDDSRRRPALLGATCRVGERLPTMAKGPMTVTGFIAYAQGWGGLYIRANKLAWKQIQRHRGPRDQEPLRHPRLPGARALGDRVRAAGRRAGRLRLRPRALLLAHPSPDQLDGRRRVPAPRHLQDPPPQSRRRHLADRRHGRAASSSTTAAISSRSSRRRAIRTASCRCSAAASWSFPPRADGTDSRRRAHHPERRSSRQRRARRPRSPRSPGTLSLTVTCPPGFL